MALPWFRARQALAHQNDEAFFGHVSKERRRESMAVLQDLVARQQLHQLPLE
jgi:hypothetical protein